MISNYDKDCMHGPATPHVATTKQLKKMLLKSGKTT